jgi:hypothetical protein
VLHRLHQRWKTIGVPVSRHQDEGLIMKQHKLYFTTWLKDLNLLVGETKEEKMIHLLASGPHKFVKSS